MLSMLISCINVDAQFNKVGRTALQFLKIGMGARQAAQGEASIANHQDINSIFWNPAAITNIDNIQASFNYTSWISDLKVLSGGIGLRLGEIGVISFGVIQMDYGDLDEAITTSTSGGLDTRTGLKFGGSDLALSFGFARNFTNKLSIGVNIKYIREELHTFSSNVWAFDVGSYYETGWKGIRLGMSAQNFSSQIRWMHTLNEEQQSFELPLLYRIGMSIDLWGGQDLFFGGLSDLHKLTFSFDAIHTNDFGERLNVGIEYWFLNKFSIRSGYRFNYDEGNLSFGVGLNQEVSGVLMQVDYAYVVYDYLESPHRISLLLYL